MGRKRKEMPLKICEHCSVPLCRKIYGSTLEDASRFMMRRFCSTECSGLFHREEAPSRSAMLKRVYKIRGRSCEKCGAVVRLSIHHKDRNWRNNATENLQTLCSSCHTSLHHAAGEIIRSTPKRLCSVCERPSSRKGLCATHLTRSKKHGDPRLVIKWVNGSRELVVSI